MPPTTDISVIIVSYNRREALLRALDSLAGQCSGDGPACELVVVDDGSTDGTAEVRRWGEEHPQVAFRFLESNGLGIPGARNLGAANASGQWLAFMDDDQLVDRHCLASLLDTAARHDAQVVVGTRRLMLPPTAFPLNSKTRFMLGEETWGPEDRQLGPGVLPNAGNIAIRRPLFEAVGRFDESLVLGGEDTELFYRVQQGGTAIWASARALAHHVIGPERLSLPFFKWRASRVSASEIPCRLKHGGMQSVFRQLLKLLLLFFGRRVWKLLLALLANDRAERNHQLYHSWYLLGYLRMTAGALFPHLVKNRRFLQWISFRNRDYDSGPGRSEG